MNLTQKYVEAELRKRYTAGEIDTGLFSVNDCDPVVGCSYVVMDNVNDQIVFTWFERIESVNFDAEPELPLGALDRLNEAFAPVGPVTVLSSL